MATIHRMQASEGAGETPPGDEQATLEARRDSLYQRLERGYARIERGLTAERDMASWEDFWISLLHEYERVCDELQRKVAA